MHSKTAASILALMLATSGGAAAQMGGEQQAPEGEMAPEGQMMPEGQGPDPEQMQIQQRMQEIQQELGQIQQQVLADNPELEQRADDLDDRLLSRMEDLGYDNVRQDIERLEETMEAMESGELSQEEMRQRMEEDRELHMELQQAQQEAMQDEEFMESWEADRRQLEQDLVDTMEQEHPRAEELMQEMEELQSEMQRGMGGEMPH